MHPRLVVITPTCDRPEAFAFCERWMARQTRQPDVWIVADGGQTSAPCTRGQHHLRVAAGEPGPGNFLANVRRGLLEAMMKTDADLIAIVEDDDHYRADYLETVEDRLRNSMAVGFRLQPYYNVALRRHHTYRNQGSSLCSTAFRLGAAPLMDEAITYCQQGRQRHAYGLDGRFWNFVQDTGMPTNLSDETPVIGIKSLPGTMGLGVGHRPPDFWSDDASGDVLRKWLGDDADFFLPFYTPCSSLRSAS